MFGQVKMFFIAPRCFKDCLTRLIRWKNIPLKELFTERKGAVKLHTLLDLHGPIPTVIWITMGKRHDINILDELFFETGAMHIL